VVVRQLRPAPFAFGAPVGGDHFSSFEKIFGIKAYSL